MVKEYAIKELKDAFCRQAGFTPTEELSQNEFLLNRKKFWDKVVSEERSRKQAELDAMPIDGKDKMKRIALAQLAKEEAKAIEEANKDINIA